MRIVKYPWMLLVFCTISASSASAQDRLTPSKLAAAKNLVAATGAADAMVAAIRANLPAQKQAMPQVPAEFWTRFETEMVREAPAFTDSIAVIYANVFSEPELHQMLAFFNSPIGRRMVELQPGLIAECTAAGQRWGARVGERVAKELMQ